MADVFISYKSERRPAARHLQKILRLYGFEAWYDYGLLPGEDFEPRLMGELRAAKAVVVLWCGMSVKSAWVLKEAGAARALGSFLPAWIEKAPLPKDFAGADTMDLTGWDGAPRADALDRLLDHIGRKVGRRPAPDFDGLRELHDDWVQFGRPSLARFALGQAVPAHETQTPPSPPGGGRGQGEGGEVLPAPPLTPAPLPRGERGEAARRAAEAAKAGRPVAERAFPIELPGVANWPNPQMIAIPPGRFLMGAPSDEKGSSNEERPQHEVRIDYAFAVGRHAVTFAEWDAAIAAGAKLFKPADLGWGRAERPVIYVSWEDAQAYIDWLNEQLGLDDIAAPSLGPYRLPTEAEWEYACRAGATQPFHFGETISTEMANYNGAYTYGEGVRGKFHQMTMPVGSFPANAFGLQGMHGNVWEWCQDCWNGDYNGAPTDGSAWLSGDCSSRVLRGGSWSDYPHWLRSANRYRFKPTGRISGRGFRLARTLVTP